MTIRRRQFRAIGATVEKLTKPVFGRRGFGSPAIVNDWPEIIGGILAEHTFPERIAYPTGKRSEGTLHLKIDSAALALELQHLAPQIMERVNTYFGFKAVADIRILQGPLPEKPEKKPPPSPLDVAKRLVLNYKMNLITVADFNWSIDYLWTDFIRDR